MKQTALHLSANRPKGVTALAGVQIAMSVLAIPSGVLLLSDPSGSLLGGQFVLPRLTATLPFITDFTLVGLWLIAVYGVIPAVLTVYLLRQRRWAWRITSILGIVEVVWIGAEVAMFFDLGFTPMYPLIGGIGALTLITAFAPSVREFYAPRPI